MRTNIRRECKRCNKDRPQLQALLKEIKPGDVITVIDLTRISRSSRDLFDLVEEIKTNGAALKSLRILGLVRHYRKQSL
jgi:DNA invertase Pin-like site-specific DNA recombinase